jgi:membrane protein DedA with SNARE-associated domain
MNDAVHALIAFISAHSAWTFPIVFLITFGESFAFISFAFPGTTVIVAAGALVPVGALPFWPVFLGAILGAVIGDAISYALGLRYGHLLDDRWPFTRYPTLLPRGYAFFEKHGGKSVFVGRFFGPMRAVVPLVAGVSKMPSGRFWVANILSALIWAPALMLGGFAVTYIASYVASEAGIKGNWGVALAVFAIAVTLGLFALARRKGWLRAGS